MRNYLILFTLIFFTTSCKQDTKSIGLKSIENLSSNFKGTEIYNQKNNFQFERSIRLKNNIEIQLWNFSERLNPNYEELLVYILNDRSYVIPLYSNEFIDYWKLQYENRKQEVKIETTFQNEFYKMICKLNVEDSLEIADKLFNETFRTLLGCRSIEDSDFTELEIKTNSRNNSNDRTDRSNAVNTKSIITEVHLAKHKDEFKKGIIYNNLLWDRFNGMLYQFDLSNKLKNKEFCDSIKIYRTSERVKLYSL